ncbi:MAG: hypothetical protein Q8S13_01065 [Dehalococcoidia bacterium]|nr:hypothetical protein [Dehalococcoidia bacterium]
MDQDDCVRFHEGWQQTPPTVVGAYWFWNARARTIEIVEVMRPGGKQDLAVWWPGNECEETLTYYEGQWWGPLPPPPSPSEE